MKKRSWLWSRKYRHCDSWLMNCGCVIMQPSLVSMIVLLWIDICVVLVASFISGFRQCLLVLWPLIGLLYRCMMVDDYGALVEWYLWRKDQILHNKTCPSATLCTIRPKWNALGLNSGYYGKKPANNNLSYGMAYSFLWKVNIHIAGQEIYHLYVIIIAEVHHWNLFWNC